MAKIGLNNFFYAKLTEASDGTPTYDGGKSFGKAVSCNVSISNNSATLYADDALAESDTSFQNGTVSLTVDDDREATFADVLGHEIDDNGLVVRNVNDVAPYVALARIIVKLVNNVKLYKAEILYKVKFSEPSSDTNTRGESVEFATPTIEGQISALANGKWSEARTFSTKAEALAFILGVLAVSGSTFRVSYNANGGTGTIADDVVTVGDSTTIAVGTSLTAPSGKEFGGWALSSTATQKDYDAGATYYPTKDVTFYAVWVDET
jgi:phi13 family phage major tail protein